ncbi:MAG: thioredoxin family protein [archaeon]
MDLSFLRNFLKPKFNLFLVVFLVLLGGFIVFFPFDANQQQVSGNNLTVNYFFLPECPHCAEQKPIILELQNELPEFSFVFNDASTVDGSKLYLELAVKTGIDSSVIRTPTTFIGNQALVGVHSKQEILDAISSAQNNEAIKPDERSSTALTEFDLPFLGKTNLTSFSIPVLAVVLGLIDGFNPCAMWVLVYLIAVLANVKDKKRTWIVVGSFVFASGLLYFLFMTAWLNVFLFLGYIRFLTVLIGLLALGGGILSVKEFFDSKGNLTCKVGDESSHKTTMNKINELISQPLSLAVIFGVFALAFVVNSIEFVCSSAIPAVFTQILVLSNLSFFEHYFYILVYDFFFMLDDMVIFGFAAFAVNSSFMQKYAVYCKILGGAILVVLGLILLFAPNLLA